ncbi:Holliday junction resolvase RuvX [bacterium]|nr:Holliday junction resolvase RuvX [bacterium]
MGRILAIDYGENRIGLALSDPDRIIGHPLTTLRNGPDILDNLKNVCLNNSVDLIILGLPLQLSGEIGEVAGKVIEFKTAMEMHLGLEILLWDERLTSKESERCIREHNLKPSRIKPMVDKIAACLLLQNYLDYIETR